MSDQVYKKKGKRYIPIGYSDWHGFPTDGIWLVQHKPGVKSSECIIKVEELDSIHPAVDLIFEYKDKITNFIQDELEKEDSDLKLYNISSYDFVMKMLKEISK
jgi:hypothetical protein